MLEKHRLLMFWLLGAALVLGTFYAAVAWLWSAAEESRAASLEREVLSAAGNDLAEGNLFKLGVTLSKLQQDGNLRSAEIRYLNDEGGGDMIFRTHGPGERADGAFSEFRCASQRRFVRPSGGGVGVVTRLPSKVTGAGCAALFLSSDLPSDLRRFKNRLMTAFALLFVAILGAFSWLTMSWYQRILRLEVLNRVMQMEKESAVGRVAAQVAHDIRSPLAALDSVLKDVMPLPEEKRLIIRSATARIRDIANSLIENARGLKAAGPEIADPAAVELLSSHVEPLVTEKRLQFRSKIGIEIESRLDAASYGLFCRIQPTEFSRVLSNLINNAVEAIGERGSVVVSLGAEADQVLVGVRDNGKGIPHGLLAKLGQRGVTHGKASGLGLGLYHAKNAVESWGGRLDISSDVGKGTTLTIALPRAQPPEWFVSKLELHPGDTIVILDDDTSIHQVWQGRFDSSRVKEHGIEIVHFSTPAEIRDWVRDNAAGAKRALYLMDYELLGHRETGLALAEELGVGARSILVTSRFEEKGILDGCLRLKVRMIPKGLAGFVPISILTPQQSGPDAVLLDDDALVRMNWKGTAKSKGLEFVAFQDPKIFLAVVEGFPKATAIYLDSRLADGVKGEDIAKVLHAKGFLNLFLTTGCDADSMPPMPWIKKVVGKEPPWSDMEDS